VRRPAGSEEAGRRAAELFQRHRRMVEGLCRGLLRDRVEAEDAAQQTFLSAYRALLGGSEPREPAAWLAAIARNECLARIRARMREPFATETEATSTARDPLAQALHRADLDAVWRAVSELPRQQRRALLLREFGGLSYDELALALGVSAPAVESLLFRARTRLRGQLDAAFASLGGAGWISAAQDAVARLLASGGADKLGAPLAAKTIGATLGAAALAGGAVVGEQHARSHHSRRPAPAPGSAVATSAPPRTPAAVVAPASSSRNPGESRQTGRGHGGGGGASLSGRRGASSGGSRDGSRDDHGGVGERDAGNGQEASRSSDEGRGGEATVSPAAATSGEGGGEGGGPRSGSESGSGQGSGGGETSGASSGSDDQAGSSGSGGSDLSSSGGDSGSTGAPVTTSDSSGEGSAGGDGGHGGSIDGGSGGRD
jgi:RNA polymerase sigma factor (sigma-70 family)